jgi:hypothetical protein
MTFTDFILDAVDQVQAVYESLEPDHTYVHTDVAKVNRPVGTVDSSSLGAIDGMVRGLERMATRALKTHPLLMGSNEAVAETHAKFQWEIYKNNIRSLQKKVENVLGRLLSLTLEMQGIPAIVEFKFKQFDAENRFDKAQAHRLEIENAAMMYDRGWISQDTASVKVAGEPADRPEPRRLPQSPNGEARMSYRAVQISPEGSDEPLPAEPQEVEITELDQANIIERWDELMPDYAGLLRAAIIGRTDFDGDDVLEEAPSEWLFENNRKRYRSTETGQVVSQSQLTQLRDEFLQKVRDQNVRLMPLERDVESIYQGLVDGRIAIQRFVLDMRQEIKEAYLGQYLLAKGGANNMSLADYGRVGRMLAPNGTYRRIQRLAEQIKAGELSAAQIRQRSRQLVNSSTQAFERGRAASFSIPGLPQYPADGSQICRDNCNCEWIIREFDDRWECTWKVNAGESCDTCLSNAARWNPLIIAKTEANSRRELQAILEGVNGREKA